MTTSTVHDIADKEGRQALLDTENLLVSRDYSSSEWTSRTRNCLHKLCWTLALLLVTISVGLNVRTLVQQLSRKTDNTICRPTYSGLEYNVPKVFTDDSDYFHDTPLAEELWHNISVQGITLALSTDMAQDLDLEPTQPFPWDSDRKLYYVKAFHQIHCLKLLRHALVGLFNEGETELSKTHLLHCIENFRQDVMCEADDTILPYPTGQHLGSGKKMVCRDWQALQDWALQDEFDSCWDVEDEYRPVAHALERFGHCKPGSRYRAVEEQYFERFGHEHLFNDGP